MTKKEIIKRLKQIEQLLNAPSDDEYVQKRSNEYSCNPHVIACGVAQAKIEILLEDLKGK